MISRLSIIAGLAGGVLTSASTFAVVTTYSSRPAYLASTPAGVLEDFEEARLPVGGTSTMAGSLNSSTNNSIYSPGEIVSGINITAGTAVSGPSLLIVAGGFDNYLSDTVTYNYPDTTTPQLTIDFAPGAAAVGVDLTANPNSQTLTLGLFSGSTLLGNYTVNNVVTGQTFFGATSSSDPITRLTLTSSTNYFGFDNLTFVVPEPASAMASLVGGFVVRRRRHR